VERTGWWDICMEDWPVRPEVGNTEQAGANGVKKHHAKVAL